MILLAARFCGADGATYSLAKRNSVPPFPALRAAAEADGISLEGIDPPANGHALEAGDSVTALVTLHEKGRRPTQWLIYFQATNGLKAASSEQPGPMVLYTSTGRKFEFTASTASISARTIGPFTEWSARRRQPGFDDSRARVSVNKDFLSLGFDQGAAAALRWSEAGRRPGGANFIDSFRVSHEPFKDAAIGQDKKCAAQMGVTSEEERSFAGWVPALGGYFEAVRQTPNLKSILIKVLKMPSLWSVIRQAGVTVFIGIDADDVSRISPAAWGLPAGTPVYALPEILEINGHQALILTMFVTAPRPPLLVCGGIIGLRAENPEDAENYLTLRIISAHCRHD